VVLRVNADHVVVGGCCSCLSGCGGVFSVVGFVLVVVVGVPVPVVMARVLFVVAVFVPLMCRLFGVCGSEKPRSKRK
jgi:hypothetical protein